MQWTKNHKLKNGQSELLSRCLAIINCIIDTHMSDESTQKNWTSILISNGKIAFPPKLNGHTYRQTDGWTLAFIE